MCKEKGERERESKYGTSVRAVRGLRGGGSPLPLAGPRFPRSNKWRMETEAGAQNTLGGGRARRGIQCCQVGLRPHALHPGAIQGKEGIKFCHFATLWQGGYPENATDGEECVIDATEYYGNGWKVGSMTKFSSLGQCRNTFVMYLSY